jgi:hypothetical protein
MVHGDESPGGDAGGGESGSAGEIHEGWGTQNVESALSDDSDDSDDSVDDDVDQRWPVSESNSPLARRLISW